MNDNLRSFANKRPADGWMESNLKELLFILSRGQRILYPEAVQWVNKRENSTGEDE